MSMTESFERSVLEGKDRDQLVVIAGALGVKTAARASKATIIDKIIESTGGATEATAKPAKAAKVAKSAKKAKPAADDVADDDGDDGDADSAGQMTLADDSAASHSHDDEQRDHEHDHDDDADDADEGSSSEPADWEVDLVAASEPASVPRPAGANEFAGRDRDGGRPNGMSGQPNRAPMGEEGEAREGRRRRRRNRNRNRDGAAPEEGRFEAPAASAAAPAADDYSSSTPVAVEGYLDLRDEGYGFMRVKGYLPSRDDCYVAVKQTRQYSLRKGDYVTGMARPAGRQEKNPSLLTVETINGAPVDAARHRPRFEDLTPLFPDTKLRLTDPGDPHNMTARIIDLIAPIGKGQRGLIVSPPKAGKTTIMKTIVTAIERNNPEVKVMVLLIDERPEEVTDMRRTIKGEVIASTFDRPSDEHTAIAELVIERAKRLVEAGEDVVIILDGITRLARAYNLSAPATGRIMSGGIDAGALYPPKKFFGAARNIEEGGSLTILATCLVDTNSRMDDAIFEEFKGTGNMELRLDRKVAERRIYPAIDVDASSTRHEELLFDRKQLQQVWKLRRVLSGMAADGSAAPGLELLIDRLKSFRTNEEFLNEIAKQPTT